MGAAASTEGSTSVQQVRSSVLDGKPLDASDIKVRNRNLISFINLKSISLHLTIFALL
jgi:hypothetical protein